MSGCGQGDSGLWRGAKAVGVEEQLRVGGELSAEVREGVSQEDDVDVGEEQRRVELEQRADEKRLCESGSDAWLAR